MHWMWDGDIMDKDPSWDLRLTGKEPGTEGAGSWELDMADDWWLRNLNGNWCGTDEEKGWGWTMWSGMESKRILWARVMWVRLWWMKWREDISAFTHCLPSCTRQESRLGFPAHVSLLSADVKASSKASSPLSMLIHIKDDDRLLLSLTPLVWIGWKLFWYTCRI